MDVACQCVFLSAFLSDSTKKKTKLPLKWIDRYNMLYFF